MAWVQSLDEVGRARGALRTFIGSTIVGVRYITIDYRRWDVSPDHRGPRVIDDRVELASPPWSHRIADSVDFGVELDTASGRMLSIGWETSVEHESLEVFPGRLIGSVLDASPDVAIWDVASSSRWREFIGRPITTVDVHYMPWSPDGGFWCTRAAVAFGDSQVVLLLGEVDQTESIVPSADNIAVLFPPIALPEWELR